MAYKLFYSDYTDAPPVTPEPPAPTLPSDGVGYRLRYSDYASNESGPPTEWVVVTSFNTRTGAVALTSADVTTALTYTPYDATNPAGYVTAAGAASAAPVQSFNTRTGAITLTSADVTTALTYTPYNATNPAGYQTAANVTTALVPYAPLASPVFTGDPRAPHPPVGDADTSIPTTAWVAAAVAPTQGNVGRNFVHNGLFNVAQRGVGPWTTGSQYTVDRWNAQVVLDTTSFMQQAFSDVGRAQIGDEAAVYYLNNTFTGNAGATAQNYVIQRIENVRRLAGKTVTVSFWAYGTTKLGINLVQVFGTGGSPSAGAWVNATGVSVTATTTWTRYSATFTVPSVAGKTLGTNNDSTTGLAFFYSAGANANVVAGNIGVQSGYINLWGVQLEVGTVATQIDYGGSPQQQLAECQRYYQVGVARLYSFAGAGAVGLGCSIMLPVLLRASPTLTSTFSTQNNCSGSVVQGVSGSSSCVELYTTSTASGGVAVQGTFTASADL